MSTQVTHHAGDVAAPIQLSRIAAAIDSHPEGDDAVVLAAAITRAVSGDLILASVEPELQLVLPGANWREMRKETRKMLARTRDALAPEARFAVESDLSSARGLRRIMERQHRQLVVCGSSHHGPDGEVRIGHTTRQLLEHTHCGVAIAPRGLSARGELSIRTIGVGFDGSREARVALATAATIATGSGARLVVRGVVDDRIPRLAWPSVWVGEFHERWNAAMDDEIAAIQREAEAALAGFTVPATIEIDRDIAAASLRELSLATDLLVIGSRRWGPLARLLLGGTGEALVHGAYSSLLIVPRPDDATAAGEP